MLEGVRETCQVGKDRKTYCKDIIINFTPVKSIDKTAPTELCSYCNVRRCQMMHATPYSVYNDMRVPPGLPLHSVPVPNATGHTVVRLPEHEMPVTVQYLCVLGKTIIASGSSRTGSSCSAIAATYGLSSAAL